MKRMLTVLLVLVASAGVGVVALKADALKADARNDPGPGAAVPSAPESVAANGVIEGARPEAALRTEVGGTIAILHVRENQQVKKGDVLAELVNEAQKHQAALAQSEVALAKAQLERLRNGEQPEKRKAVAAITEAKRAVYEQALSDAQRSQRLMGSSKAVSEQQYETDRARMLHARAELVQAEAERDLVEAPARADEVVAAEARIAAAESRLRLAQAELAKTRLLAPSDGRVLQVYAEPGEMAGPASAQPILILADLSKRRVRAFVEELDTARVAVGQRAVVTADGLPNREFTGKVAVVLPRMGKRSLQSDAPGEYKDLYFREVLLDLDKGDELPVNLRVQTRISAVPLGE